jgi:hypothetical protein
VAANAAATEGSGVAKGSAEEIKVCLFADAMADGETSGVFSLEGSDDNSTWAAIAGTAFDAFERDDDEIAAAANLVNGTHTITNQPLTPSRIILTVVDTTPSITVGQLVVVGTDGYGNALEETVDIAAGAGVYFTDGFFASITSITGQNLATLGGGGDETLEIGVDNTGIVSVLTGRIEGVHAPAYLRIAKATGGSATSDVFGWFEFSEYREKRVEQLVADAFNVDFVT